MSRKVLAALAAAALAGALGLLVPWAAAAGGPHSS